MGDDKSKFSLTPKLSFILGLTGGVLVICTIGFFILLTMVLGDGDVGSKKVTTPKAAAPTAAVPSAPSAPEAGDLPEVTADDHVRGSANADITIVEYSDFECPFCGRFHETMNQLMDEYDGQIQWVYRHFPLSFHPQATPAANASECVADLGGNDAFWEYADALIVNQASLSTSLYSSLAEDVGVDVEDFENCFEDREFQGRVSADQAGGASAGVTGTPGSFIVAPDGSTTLVPGAVPYEQLEAMVLQVL